MSITLTCYLGIYAFDNPNSEGWYGVIDGEKTMNSEQDMVANNA